LGTGVPPKGMIYLSSYADGGVMFHGDLVLQNDGSVIGIAANT
jgi:hypothetical protein